MTAVEVITSVQRRRRWSRDEKLRIVTELRGRGGRPHRSRAITGSHLASCSSGGVSSYRKRLRAGLGVTASCRSRSRTSLPRRHAPARRGLASASRRRPGRGCGLPAASPTCARKGFDGLAMLVQGKRLFSSTLL